MSARMPDAWRPRGVRAQVSKKQRDVGEFMTGASSDEERKQVDDPSALKRRACNARKSGADMSHEPLVCANTPTVKGDMRMPSILHTTY